ncbi:hypothetical protein [Roseovarius rhodophyticola]|uniref:Uncharacterized protein n=1 Tax=Roseovarius rhodophyticola TaxID=3080827 RepID=A0ABZ2TBS6_9RHOB|nr:hypothetical protein [Roseovarius sp. W115]
MIEEFQKYRSEGLDAEGAYQKSKQLGLDFGQRLRTLTQVYGLSLADYKALVMRLDASLTSIEYREKPLPNLEEAIRRAGNVCKIRRKKTLRLSAETNDR